MLLVICTKFSLLACSYKELNIYLITCEMDAQAYVTDTLERSLSFARRDFPGSKNLGIYMLTTCGPPPVSDPYTHVPILVSSTIRSNKFRTPRSSLIIPP